MSTILIKNAGAIVTVDDDDRILRDSNILIDGREITYVGPDIMQADSVIDAGGCFVYPGLINTHHHLFQTFTRNLPQVQNMELFPWLSALYEIWRGLNEDCIYHSSLVGMGELLKYGCTTCMDHHYVFPRHGSQYFIDQQFRAARDLGMRFHAARGSMSRGKSDGGLPPDDLVSDIDLILKDSERLADLYHDKSKFSMNQIVLAPCSPFSVTTDLMKQSAELARTLGVRLHTHLCETKDEEEYCLKVYGMRPLKYMESCGWTGSDVWFAHGIYFSDEELRYLAKTGTGVAHCPVSNMKLSSGVCNIPAMLEYGVPVGLAVDGSASNDCSNLMAEIRAAYLMHRLSYGSKAPTGYDLLKIATRGSASILGRNDIGSLQVGKAADLFMIDTSLLELTGALRDPGSLFGTVGYSRPAKMVMVNGQIASENGVLTRIDEQVIREKAEKLVSDLVNAAT